MSSILDALRKVEAERAQGEPQVAPEEEFQPEDAEAELIGPAAPPKEAVLRITPARLAAVGVLLLAGMVLVPVVIFSMMNANGGAASVPDLEARNAAETPQPVPVAPAPPQAASTPLATPPAAAQSTPVPAPVTAPPVVAAPNPPPAPAPPVPPVATAPSPPPAPVVTPPAPPQETPVKTPPVSPAAASPVPPVATAPSPPPAPVVTPPAPPQDAPVQTPPAPVAAPAPEPVQVAKAVPETAPAVPSDPVTPPVVTSVKLPPPAPAAPAAVPPVPAPVAAVAPEPESTPLPDLAAGVPAPEPEPPVEPPVERAAPQKAEPETYIGETPVIETVPVQNVEPKGLPELRGSDRVRLGLENMRINVIREADAGRPHGVAIINLHKVFVGERIPGTNAKLIGVAHYGIAIEMAETGQRFFVRW